MFEIKRTHYRTNAFRPGHEIYGLSPMSVGVYREMLFANNFFVNKKWENCHKFTDDSDFPWK